MNSKRKQFQKRSAVYPITRKRKYRGEQNGVELGHGSLFQRRAKTNYLSRLVKLMQLKSGDYIPDFRKTDYNLDYP